MCSNFNFTRKTSKIEKASKSRENTTVFEKQSRLTFQVSFCCIWNSFFPPLTTSMIRTAQKILFVKMICQASFDISVFRYPYQSIVDKN